MAHDIYPTRLLTLSQILSSDSKWIDISKSSKEWITSIHKQQQQTTTEAIHSRPGSEANAEDHRSWLTGATRGKMLLCLKGLCLKTSGNSSWVTNTEDDAGFLFWTPKLTNYAISGRLPVTPSDIQLKVGALDPFPSQQPGSLSEYSARSFTQFTLVLWGFVPIYHIVF